MSMGPDFSDGNVPQRSFVERLLGAAELKVLAAAKNVTGIEAKGDKIMLTRNGDLITLGGKFPRFTKRSPDGRLKELRTLLKAL